MAAADLASAGHGTEVGELTPLRREVLGILKSAGAPLKAYELLAMLSERRGAPVKPPTIYRTLEHLVGSGLVHRIESLGAYAACANGQAGPEHVFLICEHCGAVSEIESHDTRCALNEAAREQRFVVHQASVELRGACGTCAQEAENAP